MWLEDKLKYCFSNKDYLIDAISHSGLSNNQNNAFTYERMELFGDTILNFVITKMILQIFPSDREGNIAKRRAALVCHATLVEVAKNIELDRFLKEYFPLTKNILNDSILENTVEAIIAAIYIDGGESAATDFIKMQFQEKALEAVAVPTNSRSFLQEWAQQNGYEIPEYILLKKTGLVHTPIFTYQVKLGDFRDEACGNSIKKAKNNAAENMIAQLKQMGKM